MFAICKKEIRQFFSSLTGYLAIIIFLLLSGLFLFVFPDTNLFDYGYATLDTFFELAPWILLLLIPAITMRSFADEFKAGTYEILVTRPLSKWQIIGGKYLASLIIIGIALLPTFTYVFTIKSLSTGGVDTGGIAGAYIGLLFLSAAFTAIGICCSSFTNNAVVAFLSSAFTCFLLYNGFTAISGIPSLQGGWDYFIEMAGINFHYRSLSRGAVDSRDMIYFLSIIVLFLFITRKKLLNR
ncbi:gliding motility-associated ABC transporter permease subunit GldF [Agriterribacter sp.]|uniref:gliding motility-associated ABC transporter permease subunit GldF n=1 Tax=Agriterribacter sp. TaxID=2821509 RepID=UPI002D06AE77|nr:gliding motility-associated ABC transporter permease subunit GldF [Agriterribacter sp.]HTN05334.1 gliding motility-associated ABC transporter permease subunit GldF [Agriterribacter sp.]